MPKTKDKRDRRSIRAAWHDYARAATYFVTLVTYQREHLFGEIVEGQMRLSTFGRIVEDEWSTSEQLRAEIDLDAYVIMPNHVHGIIVVSDKTIAATNTVVGAQGLAPLPSVGHARVFGRPAQSLGSFIGGFKAAATRAINHARGTPGLPVWQRNYYERIVRGEPDLQRFRRYIADNPFGWSEDPENPSIEAGPMDR